MALGDGKKKGGDQLSLILPLVFGCFNALLLLVITCSDPQLPQR